MAYTFEVKVVPSSGRNQWKLDKSGMLKCYLKSAPERGLANKELIRLLAKVLGIAQSEVVIVAGVTSRIKLIRVGVDLTFDRLLTLLGIERQTSLFDL